LGVSGDVAIGLMGCLLLGGSQLAWASRAALPSVVLDRIKPIWMGRRAGQAMCIIVAHQKCNLKKESKKELISN